MFFTGVALTGIGSACYHWAPDNATLFWDRLPMTLGFASLAVGVLAEHVNAGLARRLLAPLLVMGVASVSYWHYTASVPARQAG